MFDRWSGSRMALVEPVLVSGWRIATRPRSLEAVFAVRVNRPLRPRDAGTANACCSRIVRGCPVSCAINRIAHERPQPSASELDDRGPRAARGPARRFIAAEYVPHLETWNEEGRYGREVWNKAGAAG